MNRRIATALTGATVLLTALAACGESGSSSSGGSEASSAGGEETIASGLETMPPKSTYFYPKLLTGLVLNPLRRLEL